MKKVAVLLALMMTTALAFGPIADAKGGSVSSGGRGGFSSGSRSFSSPSKSSVSVSKPASVSKPSGSSISTSKPTGSSISTSKTSAVSPKTSSTTVVNNTTVNRSYHDYYGGGYGGGSSFGGFWGGFAIGNMMHPHYAYAPAVYGGASVAMPTSYMIAYIVIDLIALCLIIWFLRWCIRRCND